MLSLVRKESTHLCATIPDGSTIRQAGGHLRHRPLPDQPESLRPGLNLTAADYVIHIDPWWNPAVEMQASDRTHRIGQDKPVFVFKLIARDSVEEKILVLQDRKRNLVDQIITTEGAFFKNLTKDDIQGLFS
jgi:non-specific serine/threonine protein kinase